MDRRIFMTWVRMGCLTTVILSACKDEFKRLDSQPRTDSFQPVGGLNELDQFSEQFYFNPQSH